MSVPNIISGTVTRSGNHVRHTPNWLKALYAVLIALVGLVAVTLLLSTNTPAGESLKPCKTESQVSACYWDADTMGNGRGNDFVNR